MSERRIRMPLRYWRWMWLSEALRLLSWPVVAVLSLVYFPARGLVWAIDHGSHSVWRFRMWLLKRDIDRAGWSPPRRTAPELRVVWKNREHP